MNDYDPISLHPDNSHYFSFRGKPTVLITSAEHYGAVLNLDFDYEAYLDELNACGMNLTRVFTGIYHEIPGTFRIDRNSMAPDPGRFICPWPRSSGAGAADGRNKFDLDQWDEAYFIRLKDFCRIASEKGVVIELTMFCPFYNKDLWDVCPMNYKNNVNTVEDAPWNKVYTVENKQLFDYQTAMVRKIVTELNAFDNLILEIMNEPWVTNVETLWQERIAETIAETEKSLPLKHLVSWNLANGFMLVENPHKDVSVYNFHYASPPEAVRVNYHLDKPIGCNETGFAGQSDFTYRSQAWDFILGGGALFNNLDYSFTAGYEHGDFQYPENQPGGGSAELRRQYKILADFIHTFDFLHMVPADHLIKGLHLANGFGRLLAQPGKAYALYVSNASELKAAIEVLSGRYQIEWISPVTGEMEGSSVIDHAGGILHLAVPKPQRDIALKMKALL